MYLLRTGVRDDGIGEAVILLQEQLDFCQGACGLYRRSFFSWSKQQDFIESDAFIIQHFGGVCAHQHLPSGTPLDACEHLGDVAHDFRGEAAIVTGWQEPRHAGSTGRVYVKEMGDRGFTGEYYPSVYGMKWAE